MSKQVASEYQVNEPQLLKYLKKVYDFFECFKTFEIMHVPREHSFMENMFSKLANSKKIGLNCTIIQETISIPDIEVGEENILDITLMSFG